MPVDCFAFLQYLASVLVRQAKWRPAQASIVASFSRPERLFCLSLSAALRSAARRTQILHAGANVGCA